MVFWRKILIHYINILASAALDFLSHSHYDFMSLLLRCYDSPQTIHYRTLTKKKCSWIGLPACIQCSCRMLIGNHQREKEYKMRRQECETYQGRQWDVSRKHTVSWCCCVWPVVFLKKGGTQGHYGVFRVRNKGKKGRNQGGLGRNKCEKTEGKGMKEADGVWAGSG